MYIIEFIAQGNHLSFLFKTTEDTYDVMNKLGKDLKLEMTATRSVASRLKDKGKKDFKTLLRDNWMLRLFSDKYFILAYEMPVDLGTDYTTGRIIKVVEEINGEGEGEGI